MSKPPFNLSKFRTRLLAWYDQHQRPLPWRNTKSPYRIWVSEIMLQQTRVAVVVDRYRDFLKRFPSLRSLAASREPDVLAAWSGLGYYRRARSLRKAAKLVVGKHNGRLPRDLAQLKMLPGIGEYTAAAVASIAFAEPHAVVDGNVRRVLVRVSGRSLSATSCWKEAQAFLAPDRPGDFNQAMMELGATVCLPVPQCESCPVHQVCASRGQREKSNARKSPTRIDVRLTLPFRGKSVYLIQRPKSAGIMPSMWELPEAKGKGGDKLFDLKHSITSSLHFVQVHQATKPPRGSRGRWIDQDQLMDLPLTGLARKILHRAGLL